MTKIDELLAQVEENKKSYQEFKKSQEAAMLKQAESLFAGIFETFPFVEALTWDQYTPHFADGDICEFSVHSIFAMGKGFLEDEDARYEYPEDSEYDLGVAEYCKPSKEYIDDYGQETLDGLRKAIEALKEFPEEIFQSLGEGKVIVTRNGIEIEETDHD